MTPKNWRSSSAVVRDVPAAVQAWAPLTRVANLANAWVSVCVMTIITLAVRLILHFMLPL